MVIVSRKFVNYLTTTNLLLLADVDLIISFQLIDTKDL